MSDSPSPHEFEDTTVWMKTIPRGWQFEPPADLHCRITPDLVEAASGNTFEVTMRVGPELRLPAGAHITMEVPATWQAHLGNCFRRNVRTVGNRKQVQPGYGAYTDVECSRDDVRLELAASYGRILDLVDVVIVDGELQPGDEVRLILGPDDGNLVQVQKHAQRVILSTGVDLLGDRQYLQAAEQPELQVVGAWADRFRLFAPGSVWPGDAFPVRIVPADIYSLNPATGYRGTAQLETLGEIDLPAEVDFHDDADATSTIVEAAAESRGVHWITACDVERGIAGCSNPIVAGWFDDRVLLFGEMHSQMWRSMGTGSEEEFFRWGRDVAGLDFCAPANHYNWRFEVTEDIWRELVATCNAFNQDSEFITLVSYEWAGQGGHKNVYFRGDDGEFSYWYRSRQTPTDLWRSLEGWEALTVPHHTKAMSGTAWEYRHDERQRLVEVCSKWGICETGGPRSVQAGLAMGHRLGFIGGTDSHYGLANQGSYHVNDGNGLACVFAEDRTRDALWRALYERRCYATTGDRIVLDFALDGHPMGAELTAPLADYGPREVTVRAAGTDRVTCLEIVRNNEVVFRCEPEAEIVEEHWRDDSPLEGLAPTFPGDATFAFYYVRLEQANRQRAWASPIWISEPLAETRPRQWAQFA